MDFTAYGGKHYLATPPIRTKIYVAVLLEEES
jgi:hypothetical protein